MVVCRELDSSAKVPSESGRFKCETRICAPEKFVNWPPAGILTASPETFATIAPAGRVGSTAPAPIAVALCVTIK